MTSNTVGIPMDSDSVTVRGRSLTCGPKRFLLLAGLKFGEMKVTLGLYAISKGDEK
jgi:hypothetical protein